MFAIVTPKAGQVYGMLESRFNGIRKETVVNVVDSEAKTVGFVDVDKERNIVMRVTKVSDAFREYWDQHTEDKTEKRPNPIIVETADSRNAYSGIQLAGDEICGNSIQDIGVRVDDYINDLRCS